MSIPMEHMTPEEIERLRLRHTNRDGSTEVLCSKAWAHIQLQDAEVERLKSFEELYKAGCAAWNPAFKTILDERDALRAKVERLREALDWIANVPGSNLAECVNRARAALEERS